MNWKRVAVFVGLLFCGTFAAAFPFGVITGIQIARGQSVPGWIPVGQPLAVLCAAALVFYSLAKRQRDRVWLHAFVVHLLGWVLSFFINVIGFGLRVRDWAVGLPLFVVPLTIGVCLGRMRRHHAHGLTPR
jgi:hypothetical protein